VMPDGDRDAKHQQGARAESCERPRTLGDEGRFHWWCRRRVPANAPHIAKTSANRRRGLRGRRDFSNDYFQFTEELRERGFKEDAREGAHLNRWIEPNGIKFDVVPIDDTKFGYGNKWDSIALKTAIMYELDAGRPTSTSLRLRPS
jgi:hypothetical protein